MLDWTFHLLNHYRINFYWIYFFCGFYFRDPVYRPRNRENKTPAKISRYTVHTPTSCLSLYASFTSIWLTNIIFYNNKFLQNATKISELVVLRIYVTLAVFQPHRDLEAVDNQSLKFKWRDRESNAGPLAPQAKSLTTWPSPFPKTSELQIIFESNVYLPPNFLLKAHFKFSSGFLTPYIFQNAEKGIYYCFGAQYLHYFQCHFK